MLATVLFLIAMVFGTMVFVRSLPEIRRYLRIRSM
jgi:hypothetical protein